MRLILIAFIVSLALLIGASVGEATLIDLDDYILSTGSQTVTPNFAFADRNKTTGDYVALTSFGMDNQRTSVALTESNNLTELNEKNLTERGFNPVKKPYPGFLKTNVTDDSVAYTGQVTNNLTLSITFASYQEAINLLKDLTVISRADYQKIKSDELTKTLGG